MPLTELKDQSGNPAGPPEPTVLIEQTTGVKSPPPALSSPAPVIRGYVLKSKSDNSTVFAQDGRVPLEPGDILTDARLTKVWIVWKDGSHRRLDTAKARWILTEIHRRMTAPPAPVIQ